MALPTAERDEPSAAGVVYGSVRWHAKPGGRRGAPLFCPRVRTLPFKLNQNRRHYIPRQRHQVTNWPAYEASLRQCGSLTVWFSDEAVQAWRAEPRTTRGGQPWCSPLAILTTLTLRAVFRLAYPQAEGLFGLGLRVPDHATLSRRAATLEVPRPGRPSAGAGGSEAGGGAGPMHLLADSTGLRLCGAGEWLIEKHGTRARRSWKTLHVGVDAETGRIVASALTGRAKPPSPAHRPARAPAMAEGVRVHEAPRDRGGDLSLPADG